MSLAAAMPGAPIDPPADELVAGLPVWHFIPLDPSDVAFDASQNRTGVWMPGFVIALGKRSTGAPTGQCSVRTSGVDRTAVVPREVKKRKAPEGAEAEKSGDDDDNAPLRAAQPAAQPKPKKIKTAPKPAPKPAAPEPTAVVRILVLTNGSDCTGERGALLAPMDPLAEAQLLIAGSNGVVPHDTGPFHEIALSFAPGAAKKPLIDLRAMHETVAKSMGVKPENLTCAIAFDQTADIFHDPRFADLPNVQLICPHLVKTLGSAACTHKLPGFVSSPTYQSYLAAATPAASPAASSAASSASSPAKSPVATKALSATSTSPSTSPSTSSARPAPVQPPPSPPAATEEIDLTHDD